MNESQKAKRKFRTSKQWKTFRNFMKKLSGNKDLITNKPLRKGFSVHHLDLREENYNILFPDNFVCLNNLTHKTVHFLYTYYKNDPAVLDRLREVLERMVVINEGDNNDKGKSKET
jgi:hypothetical protein